jgi:hypothetical protein
MKTRLTALPLTAILVLVLCASAGAAMVPIYTNALDSTAQRTEVLKLSGRSCGREGAEGALRLTVGKRTEECVYSTPVLGRNLEVAAVERLLAGTPKKVARRAFLGLVLRAGGGDRYELRVFPTQRKAQLLRFSRQGGIEYLAIEHGLESVKGIDEPNVLRLRAEGDKARVKLIAKVGREVVAEALDQGPRLGGEYSAIAAGATRNGHGVRVGCRAIVVRVPVRF